MHCFSLIYTALIKTFSVSRIVYSKPYSSGMLSRIVGQYQTSHTLSTTTPKYTLPKRLVPYATRNPQVKNSERCFFFTGETSNQKPQNRTLGVSPQIPAIFGRFAACSALILRVASQNSNQKRPQITVSVVVFLVKNEKYLGNWNGIVSYIPLSIEKFV